ncbi:MAG TPA: hypothetical protein VMA75_02895 [Candidatus Paceibacterota bacterium]|nr:hypothetical protein [Candidatus Paceibacterota bacterium]
MEPHSKSRLIILLLLAVVLVGILASIYYKADPVYGLLQRMNLIPMPERFTELYFQNADALSSSVAKGQTLSFAFTIHNERGATTTYPYIAYFQKSDGTKIVLQNGELPLASDASTTITVSYPFTEAAGTGTVVVDLPSFDQQIDFLLANAQ